MHLYISPVAVRRKRSRCQMHAWVHHTYLDKAKRKQTSKRTVTYSDSQPGQQAARADMTWSCKAAHSGAQLGLGTRVASMNKNEM